MKALAYPRISSHLKGVAEDKHYGIDVIPTESCFLPCEKKHVLIASIDHPLLGRRVFIKPENFGLKTYADIMGHTLEYIHSLGRKMAPSTFGSDEDGNNRKERIPQDLLEEYKEILNKINKSQNYPETAKLGIWAMYDFLASYKMEESLSIETRTEIVDFKNKLVNMDHFDIRIGREVIID